MAEHSSDRTHEYRSEALTVRWNRKRCIHAAECVRGLPQVFDPAQKPWIDADKAESVERVTEVIHRCPTGALTYERHDGGAGEPIAERNRGELVADGPIYVQGQVQVELDGEVTTHLARVALCRCGASKNKPFCDGSHQKAGFEAAASFAEAPAVGGDLPESGPLVVKAAPGGPLLVQGPLEIEAGGEVGFRGEKAALCRCGASANKPFCDGSHNGIGFEG